jgi:hypothetical protein
MQPDHDLRTTAASVSADLSSTTSLTRVCQVSFNNLLTDGNCHSIHHRQHRITQKINTELSNLTSNLTNLTRKAATDGQELQTQLRTLTSEIRADLSVLSHTIETRPSPTPSPSPAVAAASSRDHIVFCRYKPQQPLEGILSWLTEQHQGNPHDKGVIEVTASGCLDTAKFPAKNVAVPLEKSNFVSVNARGQWVAYNFKDKRVEITHYGVRSRFDGFKNCNNLKDWVVEVSNDEKEWIVIDSQNDNTDLNGNNMSKGYEVEARKEWKFVRLRQTGVSHSGKNYLVISGFEIFGSLRQSSE